MKDSRSAKPHRLVRFYVRVLLPIVAGALLLFMAFVWWLSHRAGPDYVGAPETLLPRNTSVLASWHNFSSFLSRFQKLQAVQQIQQDDTLAALLLTDPSWRKIQKEKDKARYRVLSQMAGDFVDRWLGQEVTLALIPPDAPTSKTRAKIPQSGLLLIARTRMGFEDNLAELVAQLHPDLELQDRHYRGHTLFRYNARRNRSAFAYCRFGNTVVISLRSPNWRRLEQIVDMKIGAVRSSGESLHSMVSLAANADFREVRDSKKPTEDGLSIYILPSHLKLALRYFPGKISQSRSWNFWLNYFDPKIKGIQWATLDLYLRNGIHAESFWKYAQKADLAKAQPDVSSFLAEVPLGAPLLLYAQSPQLQKVALEVRDTMANSWTYGKKVRDFEKDWRKGTGSDLRRDWLKPMGSSFGASLTSFQNGLLFPVPVARGWLDCISPESSRNLERSLKKHKQESDLFDFSIGQFQYLAKGKQLRVSLNEMPASATLAAEQSVFGHPLLSGMANAAHKQPVFCVFANFKTAYAHLYRMYKTAAVWSKDVRKDIEKWTMLFGMLQYMDAMRLTATPQEDGVMIDLVVPVR